MEISTLTGDQYLAAFALHHLGVVAQAKNKTHEARQLYVESLKLSRGLGNLHGIALTLWNLGLLEEKEGNKTEAASFLREALSMFERVGSPVAEKARRDLARLEGKSA